MVLIRKYLGEDPTFNKLRLCIIPVLIEGERGGKIYDLLIDTGSEYTVLTKRIVEEIGIKAVQVSVTGVGIGGKSPYQKGTVKNLEIAKRISLGPSGILFGRLPSKFSRYNILGILGANTLETLSLKIDYPEKFLEIVQKPG